MADALRVDIGERAEELVDEELHLEDRHDGLHLVKVARRTVYGLRNELQDEIEVNLIFLRATISIVNQGAPNFPTELRTRSPLL